MSPQEAIALLREKDPALAAVLEHIISEQAHTQHTLDNIITTLIESLLTPSATGNLTDLQKLINDARGRKN